MVEVPAPPQVDRSLLVAGPAQEGHSRRADLLGGPKPKAHLLLADLRVYARGVARKAGPPLARPAHRKTGAAPPERQPEVRERLVTRSTEVR